MTKEEYLAALVTMRGLIDHLIRETAGVPIGVGDTGCTHPQESRISLGTLDDPRAWECKACGYREQSGEE